MLTYYANDTCLEITGSLTVQMFLESYFTKADRKFSKKTSFNIRHLACKRKGCGDLGSDFVKLHSPLNQKTSELWLLNYFTFLFFGIVIDQNSCKLLFWIFPNHSTYAKDTSLTEAVNRSIWNCFKQMILNRKIVRPNNTPHMIDHDRMIENDNALQTIESIRNIK